MANKAETVESPDDIIYVQNEDGGVHDVTRAHFDEYLHEKSRGGRSFLLAGWTEITEAEARKLNPQLFGVADPSIVFNARERQEIKERRDFEAAEQAANDAAEAGE